MLPIREKLINGDFDHTLKHLYGDAFEAQKVKYAALTDAFEGARLARATRPSSSPRRGVVRSVAIIPITSLGAYSPRR